MLYTTSIGQTNISILFSYVDDIILVAPHNSINNILNIFNSLHTRIQFTMEIGNDKRLNFLDIIIENHYYRKSKYYF